MAVEPSTLVAALRSELYSTGVTKLRLAHHVAVCFMRLSTGIAMSKKNRQSDGKRKKTVVFYEDL